MTDNTADDGEVSTLSDWCSEREECCRLLARQLTLVEDHLADYTRHFFAPHWTDVEPDVDVEDWIASASETLHFISDTPSSVVSLDHATLDVLTELFVVADASAVLTEQISHWRSLGVETFTVLTEEQFELLAHSPILLSEYARAMFEWVKGSKRLLFHTLPDDLLEHARRHLNHLGHCATDQEIDDAFNRECSWLLDRSKPLELHEGDTNEPLSDPEEVKQLEMLLEVYASGGKPLATDPDIVTLKVPREWEESIRTREILPILGRPEWPAIRGLLPDLRCESRRWLRLYLCEGECDAFVGWEREDWVLSFSLKDINESRVKEIHFEEGSARIRCEWADRA